MQSKQRRKPTSMFTIFAFLLGSIFVADTSLSPPPPPSLTRAARLSGQLLGSAGKPVVSEAVASVSHHLTISLEHDEFVPGILYGDVVSALAGANDRNTPTGWDNSVSEATELRWTRSDNCTLHVTVPQLRSFLIAQDVAVRVILPPSMLVSGANLTLPLEATPKLTIRAA